MATPPDVWRPADRSLFAGPLLIDTHIWIWYLDGAGERMSADGVELLRHVIRTEGAVVSDISVWEIGAKAAKGKLALMPTVEAWIERASRRPGFSFLPLDREILLSSTQLPGTVHGDPADRMLIASAALSGLPLATADPLVIDYAESQGGFSVCDFRP
jgi:PIN domain nuclease of toxin-antitoxin system